MHVEPLSLAGLKLIRLDAHRDSRGVFVEAFDTRKFAALGVGAEFVLDGFSRSAAPGTVRGLHFQHPPAAQAKLVRVVRGRAFDVVVDLRRSSATFGRHSAIELSADVPAQLWVPVGFAHGFCTLEPDTEVAYKLSDHYAPELRGGVLWNDPALGIAWPVTVAAAIVSDSDAKLPPLASLGRAFD